jgi:hypothetical protein
MQSPWLSPNCRRRRRCTRTAKTTRTATTAPTTIGARGVRCPNSACPIPATAAGCAATRSARKRTVCGVAMCVRRRAPPATAKTTPTAAAARIRTGARGVRSANSACPIPAMGVGSAATRSAPMRRTVCGVAMCVRQVPQATAKTCPLAAPAQAPIGARGVPSPTRANPTRVHTTLLCCAAILASLSPDVVLAYMCGRQRLWSVWWRATSRLLTQSDVWQRAMSSLRLIYSNETTFGVQFL